MKKLKFYCEDCNEEIKIKDINVTGEEICLICGGKLLLDIDSMEELIKEDIEKEQIENMKENIKRRGNDTVWNAIEENVDNPYFRKELRELFFKCGGEVPERK